MSPTIPDQLAYQEATTRWWRTPEGLRAVGHFTGFRRGPFVAVLDTSFIRTGLEDQLKRGRPPATLRIAQDGAIRIMMECQTLQETGRKLPKFADALGVPLSELVRMFAADWLPNIRVVSLPPELRGLDQRAAAVRDLDPDDYPAAALAALLSPCIILTHDHRHFHPLGVETRSQGFESVIAVADLVIGETRLQMVGSASVLPGLAVWAATKWAADRIGPAAWVILGLLVVGGVEACRRQPPERRAAIKSTAVNWGRVVLAEAAAAADTANRSRGFLGAHVVPAPQKRSVTAAILRELATAPESMSAQRIRDQLDAATRPSIHAVRALLHANKASIFDEVRRGSFALGKRYYIRRP